MALKCRICLDESEEGLMFDLFKQHNTDATKQISVQLCEKVEYCCGVRIRESTDMPSKICRKCFDITRIWFNFRQMCVSSQVYLESNCKDREKMNESENGYLDFLYDDLQAFRAEARNTNSAWGMNVNTISEDGDDDDRNSCVEEDFLEEALLEESETDAELSNIINNIKEEQEIEEMQLEIKKHKQDESKNKSTSTHRQQMQNQQANKSNKKNSTINPKLLRPSKPDSFMCSICGNVYSKKASFVYHMSQHTNTKPHECEICGKAFRQMCELRNHIRRHTGEKPFKCSYCERNFVDRSEQLRHERVHANIRPYACNICGKTFTYSAILKNHSKLHSGEKEFNCLVCEKAFTLQHQLKSHLQTITHKQKEAQFVTAGYEVIYE